MPALRELSGVLLRSRSVLVLTGFPVDCGAVRVRRTAHRRGGDRGRAD